MMAMSATPSYAGSVAESSWPGSDGDSAQVELLSGSNGQVSGVKAKKDEPIKAPVSGSPEAVAKAHLDKFASSFGVEASGLDVVSSTKLGNGDVAKAQQQIDGRPMLGGELVVAMDGAGSLEAIVGEVAKGSLAAATNLISDSTAEQIAVEYVAGKYEVDASVLDSTVETEYAFNPTLVGGRGADVNRPVIKIDVTSANGEVATDVFIDQEFRTVVLESSRNRHALERKVCDADNQRLDSDAALCAQGGLSYTRSEGQAAVGEENVDNVYDNLGNVAQWYANYANIDVTKLISDPDLDGGSALRATVRLCNNDASDCPWPNAQWRPDQRQMVYGDGYHVLDVTGHELTHGVTHATSGLLYSYQSGAIDEAMSDVMGEIIDLAVNPQKRNTDQAWLEGEELDTPSGVQGPLRDLEDPTTYGFPDRMTSQHWETDPNHEDYGGVHSNSGVGQKTAYLMAEGGDFNGYQIQGLGLAKTFKIWWSLNNLMTSGTDYKQMFQLMPIACEKNIGREGSFITDADCAEVDKAIRATELYKDPANGAPVATPYCSPGGKVKLSYKYGFEQQRSDWSLGGGASLTSQGGFDNVNTGKGSLNLFTETGSEWTSASATSDPISVPRNGRLRFDLDTLFGYGAPVDGPSLRLQYNAGGGWQNANSLGGVNTGPWTGHSNGWASARYDLSSLAGQDVRFRFRMTGVTGDLTQNPYAIGNVDTFKVYTCN